MTPWFREGQDARNITIGEGVSPLAFGPFQVNAIATKHSHPNLALGHVPANSPRGLTRRNFRTDESLVFSISHEAGRVLVVASAAELTNLPNSVKADVVFLGIGSLERQRDGFLERYWCDAIVATGAKVVVPVHWDNFFRPVGSGLRPMLGSSRGFTRMLEDLRRLARRDSVGLVILDGFESLDIGAAATLAAASDSQARDSCVLNNERLRTIGK